MYFERLVGSLPIELGLPGGEAEDEEEVAEKSEEALPDQMRMRIPHQLQVQLMLWMKILCL